MTTGSGRARFTRSGAGAVHRAPHGLGGPLLRVAKDPDREARRVLETDTAVAEVPPRAGEERGRRRPVHVDVVIVREDELREAERVFRPRPLADAESAPRHAGDVLGRGRRGGSRVAGAAVELQVAAREVARILSNRREDLVAEDRRRDDPVRTEDDVLHVPLEQRGFTPQSRPANDDVHRQRGRSVGREPVERVELE